MTSHESNPPTRSRTRDGSQTGRIRRGSANAVGAGPASGSADGNAAAHADMPGDPTADLAIAGPAARTR
ncbi:hypothetical protein GLE_3651 [Lysobacter enzymogenes]|uniref:Uncharacterized protein n=1 Tax=Lysobacter enzymogenes TaxID=69 RepID=A0A0S2DKG5_LYSEN|nr:hypothetical protein GLE_3651 [Lysobacter enzymogenes]